MLRCQGSRVGTKGVAVGHGVKVLGYEGDNNGGGGGVRCYGARV